MSTRLAEVTGVRAEEAGSALAILVHELCTTPVGVTAIRDPAVAWERHVLDALRAVEELDACPPGPVVDVGSGGGSPAIPMALALPTIQLLMVESKTRKSVFLREAIRALDLAGADVATIGADTDCRPVRRDALR